MIVASGFALALMFAGQAIAETAAPSPLVITTTALSAGTVGSPYPANNCPSRTVLAAGPTSASPTPPEGPPLAASGGTPPYTWSVIDGSLPDGLAIDSESGAIVGTPKEAGGSEFAVEVSDTTSPSPMTVSTRLSITVGTPFNGAGTMTIAPTTLHTASSGPLTFIYTAGVCGLTAAGRIAVTVPPGWTPPSTTAGAAGFVTAAPASAASVTVAPGQANQILATGATLAAGQTLAISYGGDGVIAPADSETDTFPSSSQISEDGRLTPLVASPSVSVIESTRTLDGSGAMVVSPTSIHTSGKGPLTFTYTAGNGGLTAGGEVTIVLPDRWRAPSSTTGRPTVILNSPSGGAVSVHDRRILVTGVSLRTGQRFTVTYGGNARIAPRSAGDAGFLVAERYDADTRLTGLANPSVSVSVKAGSRPVLPIVVVGAVLSGLCAAAVAAVAALWWTRRRPRRAGASRVHAVPHTGGPGVVVAQRTGDGPAITVRLDPYAGAATTTVERVG